MLVAAGCNCCCCCCCGNPRRRVVGDVGLPLSCEITEGSVKPRNDVWRCELVGRRREDDDGDDGVTAELSFEIVDGSVKSRNDNVLFDDDDDDEADGRRAVVRGGDVGGALL